MKYKYDYKTDILIMVLKSGKPDFGEQEGNMITHYNKKGILIELELLDASKIIDKIAKTILKGKTKTASA
ncbi:MAG: DUF2283 domain-containing protein [Candidatus Micrarchaeota archaeon]|nr:DUF2283 domain-containing protein [Candidatus Micrarchaeota archaeon]